MEGVEAFVPEGKRGTGGGGRLGGGKRGKGALSGGISVPLQVRERFRGFETTIKKYIALDNTHNKFFSFKL